MDEEERKFGVQRRRDVSYSQGRCASGRQQGKIRLLAQAVLHDLIQQEQHESESAYEEHTERHCCCRIQSPMRGVFSFFCSARVAHSGVARVT